MVLDSVFIYSAAAILCAVLLAFVSTPLVRVLAYKINAIDIPKDDRRMHTESIPRMGGLAIFFAFLVTTFVFCDLTKELVVVWAGGFVLICIGILDDIYSLKPPVKAAAQLVAAVIPVTQGMRITFFNFFGEMVLLKWLSIPVTILWIVLLTNAVNLIDGLDGLACGVSTICAVSVTAVMLLSGRGDYALICGILAGCCLGFLPFNKNPAKIFMGDTGALFLGYTLSVLSVEGLFKVHAAISFLVPLSIFGVPLIDTLFSFFRRLFRGKNPFVGDRGHLHHKLVDMGFGHKQTVRILYSLSGLMGIAAVLLTEDSVVPAVCLAAAALAVYVCMYFVLKNKETRKMSGLDNIDADEQKTAHPSDTKTPDEQETVK